jgi:putative ABC transport system permease protein
MGSDAMAFLRNAALVLLIVAVLAAWVLLPWPGALALVLLVAAWLGLTRRGRQAASVARVGISTLAQRLGSAAVIVVGIAGVVGVLVALLSMAEGYGETLRKTGSADTAIVMRGASASEVMSVLDRDSVVQVAQAPGIARDPKGEPLASPELVVAANLPLKGGGPDDQGSVQLRGVGAQAWAVRPQVRIVAGRRFNEGVRELIVGKGAARQFAGLEPGRTVRLGNQEWTVAGVFESGDALESEVWADANVVADTYRRGSSRASVTVRLTDAGAFQGLKRSLEDNPQLKVDVATTQDYFSKQSEGMTKLIRIIGIVVGSIMAVGAIFGALNTMFAAVQARARDRDAARDRLRRAAGGRRGDAGDHAARARRRRARRARGLGALQRLRGLDPGRRRGRQAQLRAAGDARAAVDGAEMGAGDRLRRRAVPGGAGGADAGDGGAAGALTRHRRASRPKRAACRALPRRAWVALHLLLHRDRPCRTRPTSGVPSPAL